MIAFPCCSSSITYLLLVAPEIYSSLLGAVLITPVLLRQAATFQRHRAAS